MSQCMWLSVNSANPLVARYRHAFRCLNFAKAAATARLAGDQTRAKPLCVTDTSLVELGGKFLLQAAT
jgi:hypothetical protein